MTLKNLEREIAADWIKEQTITWKFRNNGHYLSVRSTKSAVYTTELFRWELKKCQDLNLIKPEESENLLKMLFATSETDVDLGRRLLADYRKKRLKGK